MLLDSTSVGPEGPPPDATQKPLRHPRLRTPGMFRSPPGPSRNKKPRNRSLIITRCTKITGRQRFISGLSREHPRSENTDGRFSSRLPPKPAPKNCCAVHGYETDAGPPIHTPAPTPNGRAIIGYRKRPQTSSLPPVAPTRIPKNNINRIHRFGREWNKFFGRRQLPIRLFR